MALLRQTRFCKLSRHRVPRATHTYVVDNLFSSGNPSFLTRYCRFYQSVKTSPSLQVKIVASFFNPNVSAIGERSWYELGHHYGELQLDEEGAA